MLTGVGHTQHTGTKPPKMEIGLLQVERYPDASIRLRARGSLVTTGIWQTEPLPWGQNGHGQLWAKL